MSDGTVRVPGFGINSEYGIFGTLRVKRTRPASRRTLGHLEPGQVLLNRYRVVETLNPHESRKPGVFVCDDSHFGRVVVKVAALDFPPSPDLWQLLPTLDHRNVVRTFDLQSCDELFYEIQEYYEGGSLTHDSLPPFDRETWIMETFVGSMNSALKYLHSRGIVHRDVKPANIYIRKTEAGKELVLGDFDISSQIAGDETSRSTSRADATWRYSAPEALPLVQAITGAVTTVVSREVDYYSLGVTVIELLLGTTGLPGDQVELYSFYSTGKTVSLPAGPERLVTLLSGLLIRDRALRWGAEQVDRWVMRQNAWEDLSKIEKDRGWGIGRRQPYKFGNLQANNLLELADAMAKEPQLALADLKRGAISQWVRDIDTNVARQIDEDWDKLKREPEVALLAAILRCNPDTPLLLPNFEPVRTTSEWIEKSARTLRHPSMAVDKVGMRRLEYWLRARRVPDERLADRIATIAPQEPTTFEEVAYALDPTLPFPMYGTLPSFLADRKGPAARTPAELVKLAFGEPEEWLDGVPKCFRRAVERYRLGFVTAWLRQRGYTSQVQAAEAAAAQTSSPESALDAYLRHIEPVPPARLDIDASPLKAGFRLPYLERKEISLRYTLTGVGFPSGTLVLQNSIQGLRLLTMTISKRTGPILIEFDTRPSPGASGEVILKKGRGNFDLAGEEIRFSYEVTRPANRTFARVFAGAGIGALLLGGSRLLANLCTAGIPDGTDLRWQGLWDDVSRGDLWTGGRYVVAFALVATAMVGGLYIWLWALRRSES